MERCKPAVVASGAADWAQMTGAVRATGFATYFATDPNRGDEGDPFAQVPLDVHDVDL